MAIFETFNPDTKQDADKSISLLEKALIISGVIFVKMLLHKVRKAKTYGDLYKIGDYFGDNGPIESMMKKYEDKKDSSDNLTPEEVENVIFDINKLSEKL